jgi:hypothetical protein
MPKDSSKVRYNIFFHFLVRRHSERTELQVQENAKSGVKQVKKNVFEASAPKEKNY